MNIIVVGAMILAIAPILFNKILDYRYNKHAIIKSIVFDVYKPLLKKYFPSIDLEEKFYVNITTDSGYNMGIVTYNGKFYILDDKLNRIYVHGSDGKEIKEESFDLININ